jgi:hypothetical protein
MKTNQCNVTELRGNKDANDRKHGKWIWRRSHYHDGRVRGIDLYDHGRLVCWIQYRANGDVVMGQPQSGNMTLIDCT